MSNRISPYEAGWLTMLMARGICTEAEAREAQNRVAQDAIDELARIRAAKRAARKAKKKREED